MANKKIRNGQVLKVEFTVFKAGVTENPVNILSNNGKDSSGLPFNKTAKINFYKSLGYTIL